MQILQMYTVMVLFFLQRKPVQVDNTDVRKIPSQGESLCSTVGTPFISSTFARFHIMHNYGHAMWSTVAGVQHKQRNTW